MSNGDYLDFSKSLLKEYEESNLPPFSSVAILRASSPKKSNNDKEYVKSICSSVMNMQFNLEEMPIKERDNSIIKNLQQMEARGNFD